MYSDVADREWNSADGKSILIRDLTDGHLVNILNWINDNNYPPDFIREMEEYAEKLQLKRCIVSKPYPQKADDGRWYLTANNEHYIEGPPKEYYDAIEAELEKDPESKLLKYILGKRR